MKQKLSDKLGYIMFIVILIVLSPFLFVSGGMVRVKRYYLFVSNSVNDKPIKTYKW